MFIKIAEEKSVFEFFKIKQGKYKWEYRKMDTIFDSNNIGIFFIKIFYNENNFL